MEDSSPSVFISLATVKEEFYPAILDALHAAEDALHAKGGQASTGSLRRDIAALDRLRDLAEDAAQDCLNQALQLWPTAADPLARERDRAIRLLRLIDRLRADLRLVLIRVQNALSQRPDTINFVLTLLASSRCFGHRGESGNFVLLPSRPHRS